ncbi:MAG TPA: hypothetical protein VHG71_12750 [Verrucomicrobiae bacterium]|nr:hypothetical protein [Verrucomicrobiae bacterium]
MMNGELEQFENRLRHQTLRQIPAEWRDKIIGPTSSLSSLAKIKKMEAGKMSVLRFWRELFWPNPKAWAGLAAVWIFIFILNFSTRDKVPMGAGKVSPSSPDVMVQLKLQQQMLAELMGVNDLHEADRQKFIPKPRSEWVEILTA